MKTYAPPAPPPPRVPFFHPVPVRARRDGWTPLRQAEFIGHLAATRSVCAAARAVGMARETAYKLRTRPGAASFAAAWNAALRRTPRDAKVTEPELHERIASGRFRPVLRRGAFMGVLHKPDNSALFALLARLDRAERRMRAGADAEAEGHGRKQRG